MELVRDMGQWEDFLLSEGYELQGQLDSGGFSDVFAVTSVRTGRAMAVKRIVARRAIMDDPRLKTEISCLSKLRGVRGSCVIWLEEVVVRESLACLVLELAPLGDLERYASLHWPLSPGLVRCCVRQVSTALTHCHRLQVAHRDLHPANVLLLSPRRVRLGDFGLAVTCSQRPPLCRDYVGREAYLAPEVLAQRPYEAVRADLWSLGALSAFLSTGRHPHPAVSCPVCGHLPVGSLMSSCEIDRCVLTNDHISGRPHPSACEKDVCIPFAEQHPDTTTLHSKCSSCGAFAHEAKPVFPLASSRFGSPLQLSPITHIVSPHLLQRTAADHNAGSRRENYSHFTPRTHSAGFLLSRSPDDHKAPLCRSVKQFLPTPPRSKRYRASSCDSQGSGRSESDSEEPSSPPHSSSQLPSSDPSLGSTDDDGRGFSDGGPQEYDPTSWASSAMETETFVERTPLLNYLPEGPSLLSSSSDDARCVCSSRGPHGDAPTSWASSAMETETFVERTPLVSCVSEGPSLLSSSSEDPRCFLSGRRPHEDALTSWVSSTIEAETCAERTRVTNALVKMVSKLCVVNPLERLSAEDALEMWKQSVKRVPKT